MKKYIHIVLMLLVFSSCSDYLEQDAGELNTIDKIFASEVETKNVNEAEIETDVNPSED